MKGKTQNYQLRPGVQNIMRTARVYRSILAIINPTSKTSKWEKSFKTYNIPECAHAFSHRIPGSVTNAPWSQCKTQINPSRDTNQPQTLITLVKIKGPANQKPSKSNFSSEKQIKYKNFWSIRSPRWDFYTYGRITTSRKTGENIIDN